MKLGISSYSYGWAVGVAGHEPVSPMTPLDLVARAADLGVHVLQIGDNLPLDQLSEAELSKLKRRTEQAGIQVELGARGIAPEHLRRYLALAGRFGSNILRVVIDTAVHRPSEDEVVELLRPVMPEFEGARVRLAIENHDRFAARSLALLMERIGSPAIGVCLDTANSLGAQEGIGYVAEVLAPWVVNLHVKDFSIRRLDHLMGFLVEGRPAGEGDLDVPWLLEFVRNRVPRDINVILELWPPPEERVEDTLAKEDAWVQSSVRYLRGLIPE
jgi:3-oxoisoapionate decarboxylase